MTTLNAKHRSLAEMEAACADWRHWDTYISDRTVREAYIESGDAWKLIEEFSFY